MNSGTAWTTADVRFAECPRWVDTVEKGLALIGEQ
jgi:hypothetical protein